MKKQLFYVATAIIMVQGFAGCSKTSDAKETALKFLTAIQQMNYNEAKKYATEDSKNMLEALASFQKMMPESAREKYKNEKFSIKNVEENGDEAVVTYVSNPNDSTEQTLNMKKEKGEWKVAFTKDTFMPDLDQPALPGDSTIEPLPVDTILH